MVWRLPWRLRENTEWALHPMRLSDFFVRVVHMVAYASATLYCIPPSIIDLHFSHTHAQESSLVDRLARRLLATRSHYRIEASYPRPALPDSWEGVAIGYTHPIA